MNTPNSTLRRAFGIAWQVDPETVVRSAYGISFDQFNREGGENLLAYNGPYIINSAVNQVAPFAFTGTKQPVCTGDNYTGCFRTVMQGYPSNFVDASNFNTLIAQTRYIPKDIPTGYVQAWHLDVQREIGRNTVLTALLHWRTRRSHLGAGRSQSGCSESPTGTLSVQARRPITTFTTIEESIPCRLPQL